VQADVAGKRVEVTDQVGFELNKEDRLFELSVDRK